LPKTSGPECRQIEDILFGNSQEFPQFGPQPVAAAGGNFMHRAKHRHLLLDAGDDQMERWLANNRRRLAAVALEYLR
jgi:hypothetical protein